jgi:hypothetical protein
VLSGKSLIIIDCEGCEYDLLDPQIVPALRRVGHARRSPRFRRLDAHHGRRAERAFQPRTTSRSRSSEARDPAQIPALDAVRSPRIRRAAVLERDAPQRWCYLRAVMEA